LETINTTQLQFAYIPGRINFPGHSLTLIVKGTFDLSYGRNAVPSEEQHYPTGDEFYPDDVDMQGSCRYESDFAYFKPKTDLLLSGHCHSPNGKPVPACQVKFQVGSHQKILNVFGDRQWKRSLGLKTISNPVPFTRIELRYENSFGGEEYQKNPVGKGFSKQETEEGKNAILLPNIEDPKNLIGSSRSRPEPEGFGPLGRMWQQRFSKLGTYKDRWLKERWPWFAADFDYGYFNAASPDMQVEGYLRGDEELYFENLHPIHPKVTSRLPGLRIRCFLNQQNNNHANQTDFREVKMKLDTLWADTDEEKLVLVWRGSAEVQSEEFEEVRHAFIMAEPLERQPEPLIGCHERFLSALAAEEAAWGVTPEEPEDLPEMPEIEASEAPETETTEESEPEIPTADLKKLIKAQTSAILAKVGIDMKTLPPEAREKAEKDQDRIIDKLIETDPDKKMAMEQSEQKAQLSAALSKVGLDLDNLPPLSDKAKKEQLRMFAALGMDDPALIQAPEMASIFGIMGALMPKAGIDPENLDPVIKEAKKQHEQIKKRLGVEDEEKPAEKEKPAEEEKPVRLTREIVQERAELDDTFVNEDFQDIDLSDLDLEGIDFSGAKFSGVVLKNANLGKANLTDAVLTDANLTHVDLTGAILTGADLTGANLTNAILKGADLSHTGLKGADLTGVDVSDANLTGAILADALLKDTHLTGANLSGADLTNAVLEKACLKDADLTESDLSEAVLNHAVLNDAVFEKAKMKGTLLEGAEAVDANFSEADLSHAKLAGGDFTGTDFSKSILNDADFTKAKMQDASVEGAKGIHVNFAGADLTRLRASEECDFSESSFRNATGLESIWHDAVLTEADFSFSKMQGADFTKASLQKANFSAADMKYARFRKSDLKLAKLLYTNLFEGSLEKADLSGADLSGSNMYAVEFLDAVIDHTQMKYTNLKMTKLG
jgi:uncharacterized protein YjbI with pentapeptide repeats